MTQLDIVLQSLNDDPESADLLGLKAELDEMIKMINDSIADIQPSSSSRHTSTPAAATATAPAPQPPAPEKWSRENHPAFKKQAQEEKERAEAAAREAELAAVPINYQVNDTVLAKWVTGDKGFYTARITAVTGSSTQPIYTVKFKSYDTVETLRAKDIRPVSNKRKADGNATTGSASSAGAGGTTASPTTTPSSTPLSGSAAVFPPVGAGGGSSAVSNNGTVLTAAPSVYPQAEQQPADGEKPAKKFKKIKATKELEKGKNKWQEFNNKSKFGKTHKKDSMFRTPEGVHGRGMFLRPWFVLVFGSLANHRSFLSGCSGLYRLGPSHAKGSYAESSHLPT